MGPARAEAGCLYYDLYQQSDEPDTFYVVDGWASPEAVAEHAEHPNVTKVVEQLLPLLAVSLKVTTSHRVSDPNQRLAGAHTLQKILMPRIFITGSTTASA